MRTAPALGQQQRVGPPRIEGATLATGGLVVVVAGLAWVGVTHPTSWMAAGSTAGVLAGAAPYLLGWGVMMAAMMLPSAAPAITLYAGMRRNAARAGNRGVGGVAFASVYVALWLAFGLPVYVIERTVTAAAAGSHQVASLLPYGAALTLAAKHSSAVDRRLPKRSLGADRCSDSGSLKWPLGPPPPVPSRFSPSRRARFVTEGRHRREVAEVARDQSCIRARCQG